MIYLDNAATSWPKPEAVYRALDDFARRHAGNPGRSGHPWAVAAEEKVQECRARLARLLNAESPDRVVLTLNATDALNIALKGFLREGDHVLTSMTEHNSIRRPLAAMARKGFITMDKVRSDASGIVPPEEVEEAIRLETRLLAITHCSNVLGVVNPIEEYARVAARHNLRILVDASQSVGVVPIDVQNMGLDMVAFPGHKNLFGPMGTGALYVQEGLHLTPFREGASGLRSEEDYQLEEMPFRLEAGTPNAHGLAGLAAGVKFVEESGVENIHAHESGLATVFLRQIREDHRVVVHGGRDPKVRLGPVSISVRNAPPAEFAHRLLEEFGIACRPGLHCAPDTHRFLGTFPQGTIRLSFGFFNTEDDAAVAARAVNELSESYG